MLYPQSHLKGMLVQGQIEYAPATLCSHCSAWQRVC